jgi:hypothetical protein
MHRQLSGRNLTLLAMIGGTIGFLLLRGIIFNGLKFLGSCCHFGASP